MLTNQPAVTSLWRSFRNAALLVVAIAQLFGFAPFAIAKDRISNFQKRAVRHQVIEYRLRATTAKISKGAMRYRVFLDRRVNIRQLKLKFITFTRSTRGTLISRPNKNIREMVGPMPSRCSVCVNYKGIWFDDTRRRWKKHFNWRTGILVRKGPWKANPQPLYIEAQKGLLGIRQRNAYRGAHDLLLRPLKNDSLQPKQNARWTVEILKLLVRPSPEDRYWTGARAAKLTLRVPIWRGR